MPWRTDSGDVIDGYFDLAGNDRSRKMDEEAETLRRAAGRTNLSSTVPPLRMRYFVLLFFVVQFFLTFDFWEAETETKRF